MFVCLCNGYRDSELRELAREGHTDAANAYEALGDEPNCGQCIEIAQEIIDDERRAVASELIQDAAD